jgi:AraC-like DNA-binding protein
MGTSLGAPAIRYGLQLSRRLYDSGMQSPLEKLTCGVIARHRHEQSYAAVVLQGHYEEAGDAGRFRVSPGDVLIHRSHEAHLNVIAGAGAVVRNIALPEKANLPKAFRVSDPDMFSRSSGGEAGELLSLLQPVAVLQPLEADWPDMLAKAIRAHPSLRLTNWAAENGLAAETLSRGFRQLFGISPARYRAEARTIRALEALGNPEAPLAAVAYDLGFSDQAHMTRAVRTLTNHSPKQWRQIKLVQERSASPD